ncbi:hypothetical protein [Planctomicrobium piriforme]|uniref:Uncharacterized protein n=1 Tax=Planctomicrobium piriforme TaxID=1576369 RepID=A0A1I3AU94_9PLAN|nr:hypothetical protein [Planctomicrobium piriforme]SFH53698.1 hypothetical protein SAMN05421753_10165 [Planctomicrobium piriforme]
MNAHDIALVFAFNIAIACSSPFCMGDDAKGEELELRAHACLLLIPYDDPELGVKGNMQGAGIVYATPHAIAIVTTTETARACTPETRLVFESSPDVFTAIDFPTMCGERSQWSWKHDEQHGLSALEIVSPRLKPELLTELKKRAIATSPIRIQPQMLGHRVLTAGIATASSLTGSETEGYLPSESLTPLIGNSYVALQVVPDQVGPDLPEGIMMFPAFETGVAYGPVFDMESREEGDRFLGFISGMLETEEGCKLSVIVGDDHIQKLVEMIKN